jgi:hypothetical protein
MLKLGAKRRRTHAEVLKDNAVNQDKEAVIQKHVAAYNRLLKENEELKGNEENLAKAMSMINELEKRDIIQQDLDSSYRLSEEALRISK